tara:strand:- start:90 stop:326 length:237 start_codon:yes stop_codon:yes gene_type:complete
MKEIVPIDPSLRYHVRDLTYEEIEYLQYCVKNTTEREAGILHYLAHKDNKTSELGGLINKLIAMRARLESKVMKEKNQ